MRVRDRLGTDCARRDGASFRTTALLFCGLVLGCGGRTSVLDVGSDSGGISNEGVGTQGGATGAASAAACQTYCKGFRNICPIVSEKSCNTSCNTALGGLGENCRGLGVIAFDCMDDYFYQYSNGCDQTLTGITGDCGEELNAFRACSDKVSNRSPAPGPVLPRCDRYSARGPEFCGERWDCDAGGVHNITCVNVAGSSKCACLGNWNITQRLEPGSWTSEVCEQSAGLCGFPGIP